MELGIALEGTPPPFVLDFSLAFPLVRALRICLLVVVQPEKGLHWNGLGLPQSLRS